MSEKKTTKASPKRARGNAACLHIHFYEGDSLPENATVHTSRVPSVGEYVARGPADGRWRVFLVEHLAQTKSSWSQWNAEVFCERTATTFSETPEFKARHAKK